jgi:hypothetical protein
MQWLQSRETQSTQLKINSNASAAHITLAEFHTTLAEQQGLLTIQVAYSVPLS